MASQQTPLWHAEASQVTRHVAPAQLTSAGQVAPVQLMLVSCAASLLIAFLHAWSPLHSTRQSSLCFPHAILPEQLLAPLQRTSQLAALHVTSFEQALVLSQRTSQASPAHVTLPAQALSALQLTLQLDAPWQSTPLEHEPLAVQLI